MQKDSLGNPFEVSNCKPVRDSLPHFSKEERR